MCQLVLHPLKRAQIGSWRDMIQSLTKGKRRRIAVFHVNTLLNPSLSYNVEMKRDGWIDRRIVNAVKATSSLLTPSPAYVPTCSSCNIFSVIIIVFKYIQLGVLKL